MTTTPTAEIRNLYFKGFRGSEISRKLHTDPEETEKVIAAMVHQNPQVEIVHYMNRANRPQPTARFVIQDDQHYERVNRFDAR